jgi:F420H(2)-dependent quinone reductase
MAVMPKSAPRYLNSPSADFFIKWMSRLNTWMYRRNNGQGLGGTFQNISRRAAHHHRAQDR